MCCHSNQQKCCLTPLSSLTWGSENGMCTSVSGSETTAASSTPSEREQHVFSQKHCIRHTPLSTSFCSLSLFSSPAFISHWPVVAHNHASAYDIAYMAVEFELLAWSFCYGRKAQSTSEDLDWKWEIKLILHSLDQWLFVCLAGTLGYMGAVCKQAALTNLQQMPTAARAAGHCQCMGRPWTPPNNENFSASCMPLEDPCQFGWFFCMMAAAQTGSKARVFLFVIIMHEVEQL